ncbi:hypothetical protein JOC95_001233 [Bacillus tianshenii]|uniref:YodN n=1 Tax=Sutcliffiella tianshenii TaxID=1463404 RepID=A0ABS2NXM3_9BACI|nr:hypothetical protein [Bacillus tianshenii]MBM7619384.1 hypothetical protein [Bacillus tianshenii]
MGKKKKPNKPKYKMGDIVVITIYGTVGKVTDIKQIDGVYVYEVNSSDGLYQEETLAYVSEYEGKVLVTERLDIKYLYFIGDIVHVTGYGTELFKIVGFRTEIWRYKEDSWEDIIYELTRLSDGEWLEAGEEELTMVVHHDHAEILIHKLGLSYMFNKENTSLELYNPMTGTNKHYKKEEFNQEYQRIIDGLLDVYNDYKVLYDIFGDQEYKEVMNLVVTNLKKYMEGKKHSRLEK